MFKTVKPRLVVSLPLLLLVGTAHASEMASLFNDACNSLGIDEKQCTCIRAEVVKKHGEDAANYLALDMNLRYDEAATALERAGEDNGYAASETFDIAQNKQCSSGRLARQSGDVAAASSGVSAASDIAAAAQPSTPSADIITNIFDAGQRVPLIDLSDHPDGAIIDVSATFGRGVLAASGSSSLRDFIGFYAVVDKDGGIDTSGNDAANVTPGADDYSATAQGRTLSNKLYWDRNGDDEQYLGAVLLPGGKKYVPIVMYRGGSAASMTSFDPENFDPNNFDPAALREQMMQGMNSNANLFFAFDAANPDKNVAIKTIDRQSFGFRDAIVVTVDGMVLN
ncbi:MAG: hypothetical protein AAF351_12570 [Pseudomonadota bacterium]